MHIADVINMTKINLIFFGTGEFAAVILQGLINNPLVKVELVITQPDKPVGRKQELQKSSIKMLAEKYSLQMKQLSTLKCHSDDRREEESCRGRRLGRHSGQIPRRCAPRDDISTIIHTSPNSKK